MKLILNGKGIEVNDVKNVFDLLNSLKQDPVKVAVQVNEKILTKSEYESCGLQAEDRVEIIKIMAGG